MIETISAEQTPDVDVIIAPTVNSLSITDSVLGERIGTKHMIYAPTNEMGVIFLAGHLLHGLPGIIDHIECMSNTSFPDAIGVKMDGNTGLRYKRVRIEFEFLSSNFKLHKHPIDQCDMIICWIDDWEDCPIEVIELKKYVEHAIEIGKHDETNLLKSKSKSKFESAVWDLAQHYGKEWEKTAIAILKENHFESKIGEL